MRRSCSQTPSLFAGRGRLAGRGVPRVPQVSVALELPPCWHLRCSHTAGQGPQTYRRRVDNSISPRRMLRVVATPRHATPCRGRPAAAAPLEGTRASGKAAPGISPSGARSERTARASARSELHSGRTTSPVERSSYRWPPGWKKLHSNMRKLQLLLEKNCETVDVCVHVQ